MKLIFLLLLISIPILLCSTQYTVLGRIGQYTTVSFYPYKEGLHCTYILDVSQAYIGDGFYFKMSITNGEFEHGTMYVGGSIDEKAYKSTVGLSTPILHYFYDKSEKSYQFYVYKDNAKYNYLYIAPPPPSKYDSTSLIKIVNTEGPIYYVLGSINKFSSSTYTPTEKGLFGLLCLDTSNFPKEDYYYFQTAMSTGSFANGVMKYGASNTRFDIGQQVTLKFSETSNSSYTNFHTFAIRRVKEKYLYIAAPPPAYQIYNHQFKVTVSNTYRTYEQQYKVMGELPQYSNETFSPSKEGIYNTYYIKMENFAKENEIYFQPGINIGEFENEYMFYLSSDTLYSNGKWISLTQTVKRDLAGTTFTISKPSKKYLYVAPPPALKYYSNSIVSISNEKKSNSNKVAIGVGVGVACAVIIAVIIIIVVVKNKNESVESTEIDTKNEPIHLGATHY